MRHEHASRVLVKLLQIGKTPSGADPLLQHAPEAFHGIEVVSAAGWQALQPKLLLPRVIQFSSAIPIKRNAALG
jgi:hypothetical protein